MSLAARSSILFILQQQLPNSNKASIGNNNNNYLYIQSN